MALDDEQAAALEERVNQAVKKVDTLTDTFLEHLTRFDDRIEAALQQMEDTMNARIESRVQEELAKRGYAPQAGADAGSE